MKDTTKTAFDTAKEELAAKFAAAEKELAAKFSILDMLPEGLEPTICNRAKQDPHNPAAWISFSALSNHTSKNQYNPVTILRSMEAMGWKLIPEASLVKWDNYRRCIEPDALFEVANFPHKSGYTYKDGDSVSPYWVTPNQFTKPEFSAFMLAPDGVVYLVRMEVPSMPCRITARTVQGTFGRDWAFVNGSAKLHFPDFWPVHNRSSAHVDTLQGISGNVYFEPCKGKDTASEALEFLLSDAK
jgi:hypothetical protein